MRINFGLAALALLFSLVLWMLVINDQNPERVDTPDIAIPVELSKVPPGLVVMNNPDPIRFKIRAPKDKWAALRTSSFRATVDLSRVGPGIQAVPIVPEASDPQVRVLEVIPATASIRLEEIRERTIPVKVNVVGNVPFGYVYGQPKVEPESVVASGPASLVQSVEAAAVEVRLEGITVEIDSAFHPMAVDNTGSTVRSVKISPQTVRIRLPVDQQVSYKQVGVRTPLNGSTASGYWVESVAAEPSSVTVVGDPKVLAGINYLDTAPLNVDGASTNMVQNQRILVPAGISLVQQQSIRVNVVISPLETSQVVRLAPSVLNVASGLRVVGLPSYVEVTLRGPAPIMQGLKPESLGVTLDVADQGEGIHAVKPSVSAPPAVTVVGVQPEFATLVLESVPTATPGSTTVGPRPSPSAATPTPAVVGAR